MELTLLVDQGEESVSGRWEAQEQRYRDLNDLLDAVDDPALVLLSPRGSGESTILRRMEIALTVRLPTEVEREAAAGGMRSRRYPWGEADERMRANTFETHLQRTTPLGVLPEGDSPEDVTDLGGNAYEWTTSLMGEIDRETTSGTDFSYRYNPSNGREDLKAGPGVSRVVRGGGWTDDRADARVVYRGHFMPDAWSSALGLRLLVSSSPC